jgi:glycosyltransferase involved in cell wall biosynthesis
LPALKIARVIARLNVGGPAVQAILMTKAFQARGSEAWLMAGEVPPDEQSAEYLANEHGVTVVRISGLSRKISWLHDLRSLITLITLFRRYRPDVVHTHTAKAGALGRIAALIAGVPVRVHTFHGHVFDGYFSAPVARAFVMIERLLARFTDRIIAISESQKHDLVYKYRIAPPGKVACVPLGFDIDRYLSLPTNTHGDFRSELGLTKEHFLVGWVGRLTEIKNPLVLIKAAKVVSARHPHVRFVIVGDGNLRAAVQRAIRHEGLSDCVFLYGICRDLRRVYAEIDLLALTSRNEGTPLAMLEAMASGRPVVATDVGGVRDLMVGPGVPCDPGLRFENGMLTTFDGSKLAEAINFYVTNPSVLATSGSAGRDWVSSRYSYHRLTDDLEKLYTEIALQKGSSPSFTKTKQELQRNFGGDAPAGIGVRHTG